jgi:hypothetical protein
MKKLALFIATSAAVVPAYSMNGFREMQNDIGISAVACERDEVLVNAGGWKLKASDFIKKGFKPVRVQVTNQSDQVVSISDASVRFDNVDMRAITEQFKCREILRPLGYLVASNTVFSIVTIVSIIFCYSINSSAGLVLLTAPLMACWGGSNILAPFYWMKLRDANKKLHGIVMESLHAGHIIIPAHQNAEKIILVPVGFQQIFSFEVMNEDKGGTAAKFYIDVRNN